MKAISIKELVKNYFFIHPTNKIRVRQLERELGAPLPSVIRYTKELVQERILSTTTIAGARVFFADRSSSQYTWQKRLFNLNALHSAGIIKYLEQEHSRPTVVLFGSYMRGEDTEESDIDIYIETPGTARINLERFHRTLHRKIQVFKYKSIRDVENKELANNILNGIILTGFVEVF